MPDKVYVISRLGHPLMPCSPAKAHHLLDDKKAKVVKRMPFTIRLLYGSTKYIQPIILGVDAGSKTIGLSASTAKGEVFAAEVMPRNDVVENLSTRREFRRARRNRTTRYRKPRSDNRVRSNHERWLAPSVKVKIQEHITSIKRVCTILPISKVVIETAEFDLQLLKAIQEGKPIPEGEDYQKGEMYGSYNVCQYVLWRDNYTCICCGVRGTPKNPVRLHVHHFESRKHGGNAPDNHGTLCDDCHKKFHLGIITDVKLKTRRRQSTRDAAFMGIARSEYNYVYSKQSKIFHTRKCSHVLLAYDIQGTVSYDTCLKSGRRPCKHCNPEAIEQHKTIAFPVLPKKPQAPQERSLSKDEQSAIGRFNRAKQEREAAFKKGSLSDAEKSNIMALSQPGLAFWASKGYRTFHRRNCSQISGLNQLVGFPRYQDAVRAGYCPCRHCKPSPKQDVVYSIPITNKKRAGEGVETLVQLCTEHCLPFHHDNRYFEMQTMVGKWKIDMDLRPVRLEHINLISQPENTKKYHVQPRLFLSLKDTFDYIKLVVSKNEKSVLKITELSIAAAELSALVFFKALL